MAGIEDNIAPNAPVGAQPSQVTSQPVPGQPPPIPPGVGAPASQPNVSPQAPSDPQAQAAQAMGQQALNQQQQAQSAPPDQTDQDIDSLFQGLQKRNPKLAADADRQVNSSVDDLFAHFDAKQGDQFDDNLPATGAPKEGEGKFDSFLRNSSEGVKFLAARLRQSLGRSPNEQATAFKSMYGDNNVRLKGDELYFRPGDGDKFRKVNQALFGPISDFVIMHALKVPGIAANAAATAATEAGITGSTLGIGAVPGAAASFAMGGAANSLVDNGLRVAANQFSAQPQVDPDIDTQHEILMSAGINAAVGLAGKAVASTNLAQQAVGKFRSLFKGLNPAEANQLDAGHTVSGLAQVRTAFNEFRQALFPSVADSPQGTGKVIGDAMDAIHQDLGSRVGAVERAALGQANEKNLVPKMDQTLGQLKQILRQEGITFTPNTPAVAESLPGHAIQSNPEIASAAGVKVSGAGGFVDKTQFAQKEAEGHFNNAFGTPNGKKLLQNLIQKHDELQSLNQSVKGVPAQRVFNDTKAYQQLSRFDKANPVSTAERNVYRQLQHAATGDRNELTKQALTGSGLPEEKFFKSAYDNYSQNIDAIAQFNATFHSDAARQKMVQSLYTSTTASKSQLLDGIKSTLGSDSNEWNALRGDILDHAVNQHLDQGVLKAKEFLGQLGPSGNMMLQKVLEPNERKVLAQMAVESMKIPLGDVLLQNQKEGIKGLADLAIKTALNGKHALLHSIGFLGQEKKAVDYLLNDGFLSVLQKAEGQQQRAKILEAMDLGQNALKKMQIVNVPMTLKNGNKKFVQRYAPVVTGRSSASKGVGSLYNSYFGGQSSDPTNVAPTQDPASSPEPELSAVGE